MRLTALLALAFLLAFLAAAWGDDDADTPTPTAETTATVTATAAPTRTPAPSHSPTPTAGGPVRVPSVVELVAVETGELMRLYESLGESAYAVEFAGERVRLRAGQDVLEFHLDGDQVFPPGDPQQPSFNTCVEIDDGSTVCGSLSPNRQWLTYALDAGPVTGPNGGTLPSWDQWVRNLETGESRMLQEGLVHCGGCDFRFGPRWSPSSRYVVFAEYAVENRRWLSDVVSGITIELGIGSQADQAPAWSPVDDTLLYNTPAGGTTLLDVATGVSRPLPIA